MNRTLPNRRLAASALALLLLAGSAFPALAKEKKPKAPKAPRVPAVAPVADSVTVGLWRFDETLGLQAADSGPFRLTGTAGPDTRPAFGRFRNGREFPAAAQTFVVVPYNRLRQKGEVEDPADKKDTELSLLVEIRDLLAQSDGNSPQRKADSTDTP